VGATGKLSEVNIGQLITLKTKMSRESYYFREPLEMLVRHFLKNFSSRNTLALSDQELIDEYVELAGGRQNTFLDSEFVSYIATEYMFLVAPPKEKLFELYLQASDDLKDIEDHLAFISGEEAKVVGGSQSEDMTAGEMNYYSKQLAFYKARNITARSEILNFLTNKIKLFALRLATPEPSWQISSLKPTPYPYARKRTFYKTYPNIYDVRSLTPLLNKFGDQHISTITSLEKCYRDDKDAFYVQARKYIDTGFRSEAGVVEKIREFVSQNHILWSRRDIIETIIGHYTSGDYISFVNMVPLQIEGIFHDICVECDIDPATLNGASLNTKLDLLQSPLKYMPYYEYYSFKFPVIRNQVAHGGIVADNLEHAAMMLLLDFLPVCSMTVIENIPINKSLHLIKKFNADPGAYEALIEWLPYYGRVLPDFYDMAACRENLVHAYSFPEFWEYIESSVESEGSFDGSVYLAFIVRLKKAKLALDCIIKFDRKKRAILKRIEERKAEELHWYESLEISAHINPTPKQ